MTKRTSKVSWSTLGKLSRVVSEVNNSPSTLLLRLSAPLQAWGSASRFTNRKTDSQPTKSGVVGLLAAALGRSREDDLTDLRNLHFGVRTDQSGTLVRDFQTAIHRKTGDRMPLSERWYLGDARFVAGLEGTTEFIEELAAAVQAPVFPLFLGRRSCPPAEPIFLKIVSGPLEEALATVPWEAAKWYWDREKSRVSGPTVDLSVMRDARKGETAHDLQLTSPVSFSPIYRRYAHQPVIHELVTVPNHHAQGDLKSQQDAIFDELENGEL